MISPLAYVDPQARIGDNVEVKPFAYIEGDVEIGDNCVIHPHASILNGTRMGKGNVVFQNAVIGAMPQDFHFKEGTPVSVHIGDNNRFRENVVVAGGFLADKGTTIGDENFLMDKVHVCHDVSIQNKCVLGIGVSVAAECQIDDYSIESSGAILQQFVHIGKFSLVQTGCRVHKDVPPYIVMGGNPADYHGVNTLVLKHFNISERILRHIANTYRLVYSSNTSLQDAVIKIGEQIPMSKEIEDIMSFIKGSKHGIVGHIAENLGE